MNWTAFVEKCLADRTKVEQDQDPGEKDQQGTTHTRQDFFHFLYHATDPETGQRGFPLQELYGECESLIIAGADTTAIVLSALLFYLARHPDVQARLAREIDTTFAQQGGSRAIQAGAALHGCTYLRAVIQEALRMTPPVSAEPSREVLAGGTTIEGIFFPAGVHVSTGLYCLSYHRALFPAPFEFQPERWMVGEGAASAESVALAESGFCAFSHGARGCPGKNLAWLEMSIVVAKVIYHFEIRQDASNFLGGGEQGGKMGRNKADQYQTYDAFVSLRDGPMLQFKKRESPLS